MDYDSEIVNIWLDLHFDFCEIVIEDLQDGKGFVINSRDNLDMFLELAFIASEEIDAKGVVVCGNSPWFVKLVF